MIEELKPCPFCGSDCVGLASADRKDSKLKHVGCFNCGACGAVFFNEKEAISAWNRREK